MIDIWRFFRDFLFCAKHGWSALGEYHAGTTTKPGRGQEKGWWQFWKWPPMYPKPFLGSSPF
jgi:hypothetical protein